MSNKIFSLKKIKEIIPQRYPILMLERAEKESDTKYNAVKNVTINENFFNGHFPGHPIMPGVLILEALAQAGGVLMLSNPQNKGKLAYFMSINNAKFRRPVTPGDVLRLEIEVTRFRTKMAQIHGKAYVGEDLAAEADLMFAIVE